MLFQPQLIRAGLNWSLKYAILLKYLNLVSNFLLVKDEKATIYYTPNSTNCCRFPYD